MKTQLYLASGKKSQDKVDLDNSVFKALPNSADLIKSSYIAFLSNLRSSRARAKNRSDVRGGGRKPWRQKGTGRARVGSIRSPLWKGGGVVFGPSGKENHNIKIQKNAKSTALRHALSLSANYDKIAVIKEIKLKEPKTKEAANILQNIGTGKNTLIIIDKIESNYLNAFKNIKSATVTHWKYVNTFAVINADSIVITQEALKLLTEKLTPKKSKSLKEANK